VEIDRELEELTVYFNKKLNKQRFFKSARIIRDKFGNQRYTFFIGSPGVFTAITITFLLFLAVYISTLSNKIYPWIIYLLLFAILLPFALKVDSANQIRLTFMKLICEAVELLKKPSCSITDIENAKKLFIKSLEFINEPSVERQLNIIKEYLDK
jgi:hypothetical protein